MIELKYLKKLKNKNQESKHLQREILESNLYILLYYEYSIL